MIDILGKTTVAAPAADYAQPPEARSADMPAQIGRYEIRGLAGSGAMGRVYIGQDPVVDRRVAVKVCTVAESAGAEAVRLAKRMFVNEARAAGSLDHPNILRVYDAGELAGEPYLVMEYVEGGASLEPFVKADNLLPVETVVEYVRQCAEALHYAHERGVTHRDIKPANIMLTGGDQVKIVDFGIAQRVHTDHTQILGAMGTPRYMSPEQAREDDVTGQTDLYSLGVVLYEMLTGEPLFRAQTLAGLIGSILGEAPPRLADRRPELPDALDGVVARMLAKDPGERYGTGRELAEDLAAAMGATPAAAVPQTDEARFAAARGLAFFEDFSDAHLRDAVDAASWRRCEAEERVIIDGEASRGFFVVASGALQVVKSGTRIATVGAGQCIGEMGYLSGSSRMACVEAVKPTVLMVFDKPVSEWASMASQMRFQKAFQRTLVERLTRAAEQMAKTDD